MSDDDTTRLYRKGQRNTWAKAYEKRTPDERDRGEPIPIEDSGPDPAKGLPKTQITPRRLDRAPRK